MEKANDMKVLFQKEEKQMMKKYIENIQPL